MAEKDFKILIVDSDEDDAFLIKDLLMEVLAGKNLLVDWAATGERAFSLMAGQNYNLCFVDLRLHEGGGNEFLKIIENPDCKIPVVFTAGQLDSDVIAHTQLNGENNFIPKRELSTKRVKDTLCNIMGADAMNGHGDVQEPEALSDSLGKGLSEATNLLLTLRDHRAGITEALAILTRAMGMESVHVFEGVSLPDEPGTCLYCFSWHKKFIARDRDNEVLRTYGELGLEFKYEAFQHNQWAHLGGGEISQDMRRLLDIPGLQTLTAVPICIEGNYWGFLLFGDTRPSREWSDSHKDKVQTLADRIGSEIKRYRDEMAFRSIVADTSNRVGDDFFRSLVQHLALALPVSHVYVAEVVNSKHSQCNILAGWEKGKFVSDESFRAAGNPSEEVLAGMMTYHPDGIQEKFKGDVTLSRLNVRSFAGVPCFDSSYKVVGLLSVMDENALVDKERTLSILKVFAERAGAELERKRKEGKIRNLAYHDALTGLPNRMLLNDRLEMALANSRRNQNHLAILFIDFDGFKAINDGFGHAVGDQLLKGVANRLKQCLRKQDTVARLGGDEFVLLLPEINSADDAGNLAQKVLSVVREPFNLNGQELSITLSIGVAIYPQNGSSAKTLLEHADDALYQAKNQGKDSFKYYEPTAKR